MKLPAVYALLKGVTFGSQRRSVTGTYGARGASKLAVASYIGECEGMVVVAQRLETKTWRERESIKERKMKEGSQGRSNEGIFSSGGKDSSAAGIKLLPWLFFWQKGALLVGTQEDPNDITK
jgi:hypothetical protein